ncbi:sigma-70 family RNA polymerase sigma factor [Romboutsia hominis]|uniref:RNA polymerase sigma factor, region 2 n=1 Tax=Romboutsia hominis TaxID=1507512 RepID=A0A2P2BRH2_9FIRM|nr:sigma-70 family RNA polymerase sigma factor [Romboutsia hominis]CEI72953.1 RNA polymerase sigma factor, region 2 [Romboutsia hominis]
MNTKEYVNQLVNENINIVGFVLNKWYGAFKSRYPELIEDLYQEGCIGLFKAARIYDESKGSFGTLAVVCIRGYMSKYIARYVKKHYDNPVISLDKTINNNENKEITVGDTLEDIEYGFEEIEFMQNIKELYKILDEEEKLVLKLRKSGYSQRQIANVLKTSQPTAGRKLNKIREKLTSIESGVDYIDRKQKEIIIKEKNEERRLKVISLKEKGFKYKEISMMLGIPRGSISSYLKTINKAG